MEEKKQRMQELVIQLNEASKIYYQEATEIMSNLEYDKLYDELVSLEKELGMILASSPTVRVGYEVLSELPKERHERPMLSLDKTKDVDKLRDFLGEKEALISWKLDGLTIVLTYQDGKLVKAVTRGNGEIGEVVTNNAKTFINLPLRISYKGELILRGEAVIGYSDFQKMNDEIEDVDAKYKNPRNLCSGSVRQLNNEITANRSVQFYAFTLVKAENVDFQNSRRNQLEWLKGLGFSTVESYMVTKDTVQERVSYFSEAVQSQDLPSDGLVLVYDDIAYGESLGRTAKFPRDSFAFKWADEMKETKLIEIEWSPSRTGLINPVAIFEPVELEGTTVSRASVHNLSIMEELELGIGDRIEVYKANMIIPQIASNLDRSGVKDIPTECPVCHGKTEIRQINNTKTLYCTNEECGAKRLKSFALFVSRDALNIEGLSESTLEKFIIRGYINQYSDIFHLTRYEEEIKNMEGFGEKSFQNLQNSIEKARVTTLPKFLYGLGIANIGLANAKVICKEFQYNIAKVMALTEEELSSIVGIGPVIANAFVNYFQNDKHVEEIKRLLCEVEFQEEVKEENQIFEGKNFVITGSLVHFSNRNELKTQIEHRGGKVTGTVTSKTNYLINNDVESTSSKNKKAKEIGVPIITEEEFLEMLEERS